MGDMFGIGALSGAGVQAAGAVAAQREAVGATRHARSWQEAMASTAYQRTVKDLQAAGLNPALAFGHVNTATTPQTQVPQFNNTMAGMADMASSTAKGALKIKEELGILRAQRKTADNMAAASKYEPSRAYHAVFSEAARGADLQESAKLKDAQYEQTNAQRMFTDIQSRLENTRLPAARAQMHLDESDFGNRLRQWNRLIRSALGSDNTNAR